MLKVYIGLLFRYLVNVLSMKCILQADICPLMASLIGVPIPLQSVVRYFSVYLCCMFVSSSLAF